MVNASNTTEVMATHSYRKALAYLSFTIFMLTVSIVMTVWVSSDLSNSIASQFMQDSARLNRVSVVFPGLGLLTVSLLSLSFAYRNFRSAQKLEKDGQVTSGVITNKWEDAFEGRMLYYVSYRFREDIEAWESISKKLYSQLNKGCNVPIRYLKQDPSVSRLEYENITAC